MHLNAAKRLPLEFKMILIRWIFWSLDKHMVIGDLLLPTAYTSCYSSYTYTSKSTLYIIYITQ